MSEAMWFVLGALCGVAAWVGLTSRKHSTDMKKAGKKATASTKVWVQTRNFLYYDGTEMPVVKEDLNE